MNSKVYIFGEFNGGYSQYEDDYTKDIFHEMVSCSKATTQVVVHRNNDLMYYAYIRRLDNGKYIGMCVVVNGVYYDFSGNNELFSLFENKISMLVDKGCLISLDKYGNFVANVDGSLSVYKDEIQEISNELNIGLSNFSSSFKHLPSINYSSGKKIINEFSVFDNVADITKSTVQNGYTCIYKSKDFNSKRLKGYIGTLETVQKEKEKLQSDLESLNQKYNKVVRQKKQFTIVVILFLFVMGGIFAVLRLQNGLQQTRNDLDDANGVISMQNDSLDVKTTQIGTLEKNVKTEEQKGQEVEGRFSKYRENVEFNCPFVVKSLVYDYSNGYVNFSYVSFVDKTVHFQVRSIETDGRTMNNSSMLTLNKGEHETSIYLGKGLDNSSGVTFLLLYNDFVIAGKRQ